MHAQRHVGFIGTGIMGFHMARRLAEAGFSVRAWNRSPEKVMRLEQYGVVKAGSVTEAATNADVVICMLSSGPVCDEILFDSDKVACHMTPGSTLIVMSSIPVSTATRQEQLAKELGLNYLDAPVSGGEKGAEAGSLAIMVGGKQLLPNHKGRFLKYLDDQLTLAPSEVVNYLS